MNGGLRNKDEVGRHTTNRMSIDDRSTASCTIVVVAKCPIPGHCKTRLIPMLGSIGAAALSKAMLADVLTSVDQCKELDHADKMILYAPPHDDARDMMLEILKELAIEDHRWILHPVPTTPETTTTNAQYNMRCSKLSDLLEHAVETARNRRHPIPTTVVLMGMDSPILPMDELIAACQTSASAATNEREDNRNIAPLISALLCPADDGGYGLLSVPPTANAASIFRTVEWSHRLTSVSQLKALTDNNIPVILGPLMYDIDTQEDMQAWIRRNLDSSGSTVLPIPPSPSSIEKTQSVSLHCCLNRPSGWVNGSQLDIKPATGTATMTAVHTRNALLDLGLLQAQRMTNVEMPTNAGANNR